MHTSKLEHRGVMEITETVGRSDFGIELAMEPASVDVDWREVWKGPGSPWASCCLGKEKV